MKFVERTYGEVIRPGDIYILGADIGGTNSNFGFFAIRKPGIIELVLSVHAKSQTVDGFSLLVRDVLDVVRAKYNITVKKACFAAAGVVSEARDFVKPTNLSWSIDAQDMVLKTDLEAVYLVNDFEIIGYGADLLPKISLVQVNRGGTARRRANRAILGAGTGLGKCILVWNDTLNRYVPCSSEGGHADFAVQTALDLELVDFIQSTENRPCNISWEDVLSGQGIKRIHAFFTEYEAKGAQGHHDRVHPDFIFNNRNHDPACHKTFELYAQLYARCAKNLALDALALNGVYIAGGIAAKNLAMFDLPLFMDEFVNCGKQARLLQQVPIFVIADYNVSLYGAAQYLVLEGIVG